MPQWLLILSEIAIFVLGAGSMLLLSLNNKYSKWGMVAGLAAEPFWFISAANTESWGIFGLSVIYTATYLFGIYNWFRVRRKIRKRAENV